MSTIKSTPKETPIGHLEAALGFILCRSLALDSAVGRAPEVTRFLERLLQICIEFAAVETPQELRDSVDLMFRVRELCKEFGPVLWPDSVPRWAFDPTDRKQVALNKLAKVYPRQLRYSHLREHLIIEKKLQEYVVRKILAHRAKLSSKKPKTCGAHGLDRLPGWKESKPVSGDNQVGSREDLDAAEDEEDTCSDYSCPRSSSVGSFQDARQSHQRQKTRHYGAPTARMVPASNTSGSGLNSEIASNIGPNYQHEDRGDRVEAHGRSKRARSPNYEVDESSKPTKSSRKTFQNTQHPQHNSGSSAPTTAHTSLRQGPTDVAPHNKPASEQGCRSPRHSRHNTVIADSEESEDTATPSRRRSRSRHNRSRSVRATNLPAICNSPQQGAASKASGAPKAAELAYVPHDKQVTESNNMLPASQASEGTGDADRRPRAKAVQLLEDVIMRIFMERDNEEVEAVRATSLEGVTTTRGLFALLHDQIEEFLAAGEAILRVGVKRHSSSLTTNDLIAGFVMRPESSRSGKDQSWELLLQEMQDRSVETGVCVRMKLEATVLVGKAVGESRQ